MGVSYEHDDAGRPVREITAPYGHPFDPYVSAEYTYDDAGRLVCEDHCSSGGYPQSYYTFRYDDQGRLVERGRKCEV